jgi:hypothetical protein
MEKTTVQEAMRNPTHQNMNPAKAHPFIQYSLIQAAWQTLLGPIPVLILPHIFIAKDLSP